MGDRTTGTDGVVVYRLPMGEYNVEVLWKDTIVYDRHVTIDSNDPHDLRVDVYYPTFVIIDSREVPLNGALVTMAKWSNGRIMGSQLTDGTGTTEFRMPADTYTVSVVWLDTLVHQDEYGVDSNEVYTVNARVYYVQFTAVDSRDIGLEWAQVGVVNSTTDRIMGSMTADTDGWTEFRLPVGTYLVDVFWQHAVVHTGTWTVEDDAEWTIHAWVYYVTFHVTDGDNVDLAGAAVALANETASTSLGPVNTDASGDAEFRLPMGDVYLEVVWKSTAVFSQEVLPVTEDATVEVVAWVYYITVRVKDSNGERLKDANIRVTEDRVPVEAAVTPKDGVVVFRLPYGGYQVHLDYATTYYLTPIDVSKTKDADLMNSSLQVNFDLTKDDYPVPFYMTNLFYIILVIVLLVLLIVFLIHRMRKAPEAGEAKEEPIEYGDDDLDGLLEDLSANGGPAAAGAAAGAAVSSDEDAPVEEYSDDDLEETEEYSDEDLEEESGEEKAQEEDEEEADEEPEEEERAEG
jgi:hypothetical protein